MLRSTQQQAAFSNTVELRNCQLLLVVSPHAQHLDDFLRIEDLIDEPMLDIDSARVCPGEISDELLVRRRILERVGSKDAWQMLRLFFQASRGEVLGVFLGMFGKDNLPAHHSRPLAQDSTGSFMPDLIDSRMPGTDSKWRVSWMAAQSSSDSSTALARLPEMRIGSWDSAA